MNLCPDCSHAPDQHANHEATGCLNCECRMTENAVLQLLREMDAEEAAVKRSRDREWDYDERFDNPAYPGLDERRFG